jgi:cell division septation protein DedD
MFGVLIGLLVGLSAAVAVALFVTKVPMPFVDKFSRDPAKTLLPDVRDAPDPNIGLYGQYGGAGTAPTGPVDTGTTPLPGAAPGGASSDSLPAGADNLGDFIAGLATRDRPAENKAAANAPPVVVPGTGVGKPPVGSATAGAGNPVTASARPADRSPADRSPTDNSQTTYFLQAGAFRSERDAEGVTAKILMLGLPAQIQKAQVNGGTMHRVRVGPFKGIDEMNRSRARLGEEKIDSSVIRQ